MGVLRRSLLRCRSCHRSGRPATTRCLGGCGGLEEQPEGLDGRGLHCLRLRCMTNRCLINLRWSHLCWSSLRRPRVERCRHGLLGALAWGTLGRLASRSRCGVVGHCARISGRLCHSSGRTIRCLLWRAGLLGGLAWRTLGSGLLDRCCGVGRRIWCDAGTEDVVVVGCHLGVFPSATWQGPHPGRLALIAAWCAVGFVSRAECGRDGSRIATSWGSRCLARHRLRCR